MTYPLIRIVLAAALLTLVSMPAPGRAGDWPQILGPERNGIAAADEQLAAQWPPGGPSRLWERPVGRGFAGPAVADGMAVAFYREGDREIVAVLDASDGAPVWSDGYPTSFVPQYGRDDGPLCVPTIAGESLVTFGAEGVLTCWNLADGEVLWRRATQQEFDVLKGYFGAGSAPLVTGGRVIVNVGARDDDAGLVAFDLENGETVWTAVADGASYSSPVQTVTAGRPLVVALTRFHCVGVDPADGAVRFKVPYGLRGANVTAANPVIVGDGAFLSAAYGIGAVFGRLTADGFEEIWSNDRVMSSQYTTCIEHDGLLYGIDGRQDIPPATLRCFDPATGHVHWSEENFGYATLLKADGKLLIFKSDGEFILAEPSAERFAPLARARLFEDTVRALPALSDGRLYARDGDTLRCFDLRPADER